MSAPEKAELPDLPEVAELVELLDSLDLDAPLPDLELHPGAIMDALAMLDADPLANLVAFDPAELERLLMADADVFPTLPGLLEWEAEDSVLLSAADGGGSASEPRRKPQGKRKKSP